MRELNPVGLSRISWGHPCLGKSHGSRPGTWHGGQFPSVFGLRFLLLPFPPPLVVLPAACRMGRGRGLAMDCMPIPFHDCPFGIVWPASSNATSTARIQD